MASAPETGLPESSPTGSHHEDDHPDLPYAERAPAQSTMENVLEHILDKLTTLSKDVNHLSSDVYTVSSLIYAANERLVRVENRDLNRPPSGQRLG